MSTRLQRGIRARCKNDGKVLGVETNEVSDVIAQFTRFATNSTIAEVEEFIQSGTTFAQDYRRLLRLVAEGNLEAKAFFNKFMLWKLTK